MILLNYHNAILMARQVRRGEEEAQQSKRSGRESEKDMCKASGDVEVRSMILYACHNSNARFKAHSDCVLGPRQASQRIPPWQVLSSQVCCDR